MRLTVIIRTFGVLFLLFSTTILPPLAISLLTSDAYAVNYSVTLLIALSVGLILWWPLRNRRDAVRNRDGFAIVALMWTAMSLLGAVPFMLVLKMGFVDALFESASGYTTTGSTVIVGLDSLPRSILFYRQELQWLGGIGFIVLAIALLPMLGIGGMQLYKAETPGPFKDERITPRIARTAKNICTIYVVLTGLCAWAYWFAGMSGFDAVAHSLSTLSTGGYSTHDASIAYFDSALIEAIAIAFMLVGSISFSVHFIAWHSLKLNLYLKDSQVIAFLWIVFALVVLVALQLYGASILPAGLGPIRVAAFEVVSVITTTGYGLRDFSGWPLALPVMLIFASFIGGCAGSSAGGMKVIRFVILAKQTRVHIRKLIHPQSVTPVRIDGEPIKTGVVEGVWGFFTIYVAIFVVFMTMLMLDGMDQITAFGAVATCMNNLGPGLGEVATAFTSVSATGKLILVLAMFFGRLEIFTFLVLLTPGFWRG